MSATFLNMLNYATVFEHNSLYKACKVQCCRFNCSAACVLNRLLLMDINGLKRKKAEQEETESSLAVTDCVLYY